MENISLSPQKIFDAIGLSADSVVADFGCGPGLFSVSAAQKTTQIVHAIDIRTSMLDVCSIAAHEKHLKNLQTVHANLEKIEGSGLSDDSVDLVIMRRIIGQNALKHRLFNEARRILRSGGTLMVIGFSQKHFLLHNALSIAETSVTGEEYPGQGTLQIPKEEVVRLGEDAGFSVSREFLVNDHHYGLLFDKDATDNEQV